jgi:hypothetical protein
MIQLLKKGHRIYELNGIFQGLKRKNNEELLVKEHKDLVKPGKWALDICTVLYLETTLVNS